jgi:quinol monooxygenase YgiN
MIILNITLNVLPEKYKELEQTLFSMNSDLCKKAGCKQADFWRDSKDENQLHMVSHWENQKELDAYLRSDSFSALMGTKILLRTPPSVSISEVMNRATRL